MRYKVVELICEIRNLRPYEPIIEAELFSKFMDWVESRWFFTGGVEVNELKISCPLQIPDVLCIKDVHNMFKEWLSDNHMSSPFLTIKKISDETETIEMCTPEEQAEFEKAYHEMYQDKAVI